MLTIDHSYWKHNEREAVQFLDLLEVEDIYVFMNPGENIETIMDNIQEAYNNDYKKEFNTDEDLFHYISASEFQEYTEKRFNSKFRSEIRTVLVKF